MRVAVAKPPPGSLEPDRTLPKRCGRSSAPAHRFDQEVADLRTDKRRDGPVKLPRADAHDAEPLAGFTVAVTADRRRDELATLLERRGARVVVAPALRIMPLPDDAELRAATVSCVDKPPDIVVATTGIGLRGWLEAADGWGLAEPLRARLTTAHLVARGPKARGAARAAGLAEDWAPPSESSDEVLDYLMARG